MRHPKVSVIVPVYKAEKYIERCCKSLFEQTLQDIEYIFVDDNSRDRSIDLIHRMLTCYPNRQDCVKIFKNDVNCGVSYSRQKGLDNATGDFIIHCDSDDWVDTNAYENAYNCAILENADVVRFGYIVEYSNGYKKSVAYMPHDYYFKKISFDISPQTGSLCVALIRRSLLKQYSIRFPQNTNWGEDFCVSISSILVSKKTICLSDCFYHYWQNTESITHTITKEKCLELVRIGKNVEDFLQSVGLLPEYKFQLNYLKFQSKAMFLSNKYVRDLALWEKIYPECNIGVMKYDYPLYFRIISWLQLHKFTKLVNSLLSFKDKIR